LRKLGISSILYLDNMLMVAGSKEEAKRHVTTAMELFVALGFIINMRKSTLTPTQELEFLSFLLNSHINMTITLLVHKLHALRKMVRQVTDQGRMTVRELASLLGTIAAAHLAVLPTPLHYRHPQRAKSRALKRSLTGRRYTPT